MKRRKILFENPDFLKEPQAQINTTVEKTKSAGKKRKKKKNLFYNFMVGLVDHIAAIIVTIIASAVASLIVIAIINGDSDNIIEGIKKIFTVKP